MSSNINNEGHAASASVATAPAAFSSVDTTHAASAYAATPPASSASVSTTHSTSDKNPVVINLCDTASIITIPAEEENDGLPINKKLLNAYEEIITLVCGNELHQEAVKSKEKELGARLLIKMKAYVLSDRFNIDFADQLKNERGGVFSDHFNMFSMTQKYKIALQKMFDQQDSKITARLFDQYRNIVILLKFLNYIKLTSNIHITMMWNSKQIKHLQYTWGKDDEVGYCSQKECVCDVWAILILLDDMYNANGRHSIVALW
jgi:hypothetical protein